MSKAHQLTYKKSGIDYGKIDPVKLMAQKAASATAKNLTAAGYKEVAASRGESAYVIDLGSFYLASVTEGLGTKALVADAMYQITGKTYYDQIAQDTVAMAVNDLITVGARPLTIHAYWASGSSDWFSHRTRMNDLVQGWQKACHLSGTSWGGGETPALTGVISQAAVDLAASCVGVIKPKTRLTLGDKLQAGDAIILFASSGIHANGLTLARRLADRLPQKYTTKINGGQTYGAALLQPTMIYAPLIQALFAAGVELHYMVSITGHGFQKLMRHPQSLTYRLNLLPPLPPVLQFIIDQGLIESRQAYSTFNMGAGFAIYVPQKDVSRTISISQTTGIKAYLAGKVEAGPKQVIIEPLNLVYQGRNLHLRA